MLTIKTHNTRRTLEAMAKRHREDARTLAKILSEVLLDDGETQDGVLTVLSVALKHLKNDAERLENLAAPEGAE